MSQGYSSEGVTGAGSFMTADRESRVLSGHWPEATVGTLPQRLLQDRSLKSVPAKKLMENKELS